MHRLGILELSSTNLIYVIVLFCLLNYLRVCLFSSRHIQQHNLMKHLFQRKLILSALKKNRILGISCLILTLTNLRRTCRAANRTELMRGGPILRLTLLFFTRVLVVAVPSWGRPTLKDFSWGLSFGLNFYFLHIIIFLNNFCPKYYLPYQSSHLAT